jgi:hypothetical protein
VTLGYGVPLWTHERFPCEDIEKITEGLVMEFSQQLCKSVTFEEIEKNDRGFTVGGQLTPLAEIINT